MYLSKLSFIPSRLRCKDLAMHRDLFREHQIIWELFDNRPDSQRDFLYRREDSPGRLPFYYVLSLREPMPQSDLDIQIREFDPKIEVDDRLTFSLRANAVVTRKAAGGGKRRIRRDIIEARVDHYKEKSPDLQDRPSPAVIHQEAAEIWLKRQGERHGFEPEGFFVENHRFHKVKKPDDTNQRHFTSLDFQGRLRVTNSEAFCQTLFSGLGRSKAFGCGLLLVRRA